MTNMDDESMDGYCGANPNAAREVFSRKLNIEQRLRVAMPRDVGIFLPREQGEVLLRIIDVLRRVAENDCTNPAREAQDVLSQL